MRMSRLARRLLAMSVTSVIAACAGEGPREMPVPSAPAAPAAPMAPPVAAVHPYTVHSPNGDRVDDYYWLRDDTRQSPEMLAYLNAENAYRDAMTQHVRPL